jgi:glutamine synthetase
MLIFVRQAAKAALARRLRLEKMVDIRKHCDQAEALCPHDSWSMATYKELLFLDQHHTEFSN